MSTISLADRLALVVQASTQEHRRYKHLEEITGIAADRWKAFALGRQRPTAEMIEAVCQEWPEHALWLTTGITDSANGHVGVSEAYATEINLAQKPEQVSCIRYIRHKTKIYRLMKHDIRDEITKDEAQELYRLRRARDTEQLGRLTHGESIKEGKATGYFDPRLMRHQKPEADYDEEGPDSGDH